MIAEVVDRQPSPWSQQVGNRSRATATLLVAALLALGACEGTNTPHDDGVTAGQFQDVVVPMGLRLVDDAHQSYSRQEAEWRMGRFFYTGSTRLEEAVDYVRQRMPQHNWQLVTEEVVAEQATTRLRFVRGHYSAEYSFLRQEGATQMVVDYKTDYTSR